MLYVLLLNFLTYPFNVIVIAARKKYKKGQDKTWKTNARRGSGSRHRDRSPGDSDGGTPPPSMKDGEAFSHGLTSGHHLQL